MPFLFLHWAQRQHATLHLSMTPLPRHASDFTLTLSLLHPMMDMMYRPLLPPTQYCPCNLTPTRLSSLPHSNSPLPFYRALFVPYTPLWVNSTPQKEDNSPSVDPDTHSLQQAGIDYRLAFERKKKTEAKYWDSMASFCSLYIPRGRWHWTHQVTFEDRSEEIRISDNQQYTLAVKSAKIYQETITYIRKLWYRETKWEGFAREVALHKTQLRAIHGATVPALIGVHSNFHGIQMTYDIPHHSFWIEASPDMPDVLKRRCLQAYDQLHCQGVLHGNIQFENMLIAGDGRVKIINFDRSRSSKPLPKVNLEAANHDDFKLEMREIHYKLDYMGARQIEHRIWKNKDGPQAVEPAASNTSRIHAHYPYSISRETSVDPAQWILPESWKPKRFVVPGQSTEQYKFHLKQFLLGIADEAGEGMDPPKYKGPTSQKLKKRKRDDGDSDDSDSSAHKRVRMAGDTNEIGRKVRFEQETDYSDGTMHTKRRLAHSPPPGQKRSVPRIPRERREAYERGLHPGSGGYAANIPPDTECPHMPPSMSQLDLQPWELPRSSEHQDVRPTDESNTTENPRSLGKRGRVDGGETSHSEGPPQAKRLRRTETMLSVMDDPDGSVDPSSSQEPPPPRYSLRSSARRMQPVITRTPTRRNSSLATSSDRQMQVSDANSIPQSPLSSMVSSRIQTSGEMPWTVYQQTSANQMILGRYSDATSSLMPSGIRVITYDELNQLDQATNQRPVEPLSPVQTIRSIAAELLSVTARAFVQAFTLGLGL